MAAALVVGADAAAAEVGERMDQLEAMHAGMLSVMLETLSLRDPMTARQQRSRRALLPALLQEKPRLV